MSNVVTGATIARYFERVLGARKVAAFDMGAVVQADAPGETAVQAVPAVSVRRVCRLIEVGSASTQPSLQQMGARLLEAIRNEWLKQSTDHLPEVEWVQAIADEWQTVVEDSKSVVLDIVCGALGSHNPDANTLHVPSLAEMNSNPVLKRDAWRAIQQSIRANASH